MGYNPFFLYITGERNGSKGFLNDLVSILGLDLSLPTDKGRIKVQLFFQLWVVCELFFIKCRINLSLIKLEIAMIANSTCVKYLPIMFVFYFLFGLNTLLVLT